MPTDLAVHSSRLRGAAYPLALAAVRLRHRTGRTVAVAFGVAVGAAALAVAVGGSVAVQDRAVQRSLAELEPSERAVQAVWSGVPAQSELSAGQLDRAASRALRRVTGAQPARVMLFREAAVAGAVATLGAIDGLARWVVVRSGRLPRRCTAARCELFQVGGSGKLPRSSALRLVGAGTFRRGAPFGAYFGEPSPARAPVVVANGVAGLRRLPLPDADLIARTYGWVATVAPRALHEWELGGFDERVGRAASELAARDELFGVAAPVDRLAAIRARARVSGRRLLLVGGDVALLLLGFGVLAATRLRRDAEAARRRLTWFGGRPAQAALLTTAESAGIALAAVAAGWAAGVAGAAVFADHLGADAGAVLVHSVVSGRGLGLAAVAACAAALVVVVSLHARPRVVGAFTVLDACALGAAGAIALALARGDADAGELASGGGTGVVLLLLPVLVVVAVAAVIARAVRPLLRLLERLGRRGSARFRFAALSLARDAGRSQVAAVFVAISVGLALFAAVYRTTLVRNQSEQAAFAVPADYVVSEDLRRLVTVQAAAPPSAYRRLGAVTPVFRSGGNVAGRGALAFTLVGLPAERLPSIDGWRDDFADESRPRLARALGGGARGVRGPRVPADARALELSIRVAGDPVALTLSVRNPRGDFSTLQLGELHAGETTRRVRVAASARGGRIVAVRIAYPSVAAFLAGHRETGTTLGVSNASRGTLVLGAPRALGGPHGAERLGGYRGWTGVGGVSVETAGSTAHVRYAVNRARISLLRAGIPGDGEPVPVLVSPRLAAAAGPGGVLPLDVSGDRLSARVVGIVRSFPSVEDDAVVADLDRVANALNGIRPGAAVPGELWLEARGAAASRLARAPFDALDVASQREVEEQLRSDPLSRGSLGLVGAAAVTALVLALVGLLLIVVGDVRDESGELYDLELQGAGPADIRAHLRLRAALVAATGTAGGILLGLVLAALVVDVVTVTAGGTSAVPPLRLELDWPVLALGVAGFAAAAALVAAAAAAPAYRAVARRRFAEGLS